MRRDANVICLCHDGDLLGLGDTSRMSDVRLSNIDTSLLEVRSVVFPSEQTFSELWPSDSCSDGRAGGQY
jgi:hypothetical protein